MIFRRALNQITFFHKQTKDCYSILGLTRSADHSEIKAKYFELVKIYHPDHNKDPKAEETFKEILKAYETLKDPIKRQLYDSDPINFDQSGSGFSANEMKPESSYYKDKNRREFYQNRWYGYQKPKEQTLYDEVQQDFHYEDELNFKGILKRASFIILLYFIWDGYRMYGKWRHEKFLEISREIINSQYQNNEIDQYIEDRQTSLQYESQL